VFITAGFDPRRALHTTRLFTGSSSATSRTSGGNTSTSPREPATVCASDCTGCPSPSIPRSRLRSLATVLATYDGAARLDEGLAIVLAALRSQLRS